MPVNDTTANRSYQKPNIANTLSDDVGRLRSALDAIDTDMASKAPSAGPTFTGVTTVAAGSAAAPSLTFTGATSDTGLYSPGADQVAISTGGTGRLFVDASGNVGIGTSSPQNALVVSNSGAEGLEFVPSASGSPTVIAFNRGTASYAPLTINGSEQRFQTSGTERARIDSSGRLLVGTSSASVFTFGGVTPRFQVEGTDASTGAVSIARNSNDANGAGLIISKSRGTIAGSNAIVSNNDTIADIRFEAGDGTQKAIAGGISCQVDGTPGANDMPGRLVFYTTADGASSPTERLRITSDGKVGIGTSSPAYLLDVAGSAGVDVFGSNNGVNYLTLRSGYTPSQTGGIGFKCYQGDVGSYDALGMYGYGGIAFSVYGAERMRISSDGKVGIGTSSPSSRLHVSGTTAEAWVSDGTNTIVTGGWDGSTQYIKSLNIGTAFTPLTHQATAHIFRGEISEYARIDSSGRLLVGTSTSTGNGGLLQAKVTSGPVAYFEINEGGYSQNAIDVANAANFGFRPFRFFVNGIGGTEVGSISCSTTATSYVTSSDYRLKENVTPVTDGITRLQQLKPSRFNFIAEPGKTVDGFIAHEAQAVVPEAVTGTKDAVDVDGKPVYQGIDQSKLVPLLTAALQEAVAKIESLEARLTAAGI